MLAPGAAAAGVVEEHGLQSIERGGEARVGGRARVELLPQGPQLGAEIGRQQREQSIGGATLTLVLIGSPGLVVTEGVAGIDLDQVVHQDHLEHAGEVEAGRAVLGEQQRHHREVPGVLGRVLAPRAFEDRRAPEHGLELVDLEDEVDLGGEPGRGRRQRRGRWIGDGHGSSLYGECPAGREAADLAAKFLCAILRFLLSRVDPSASGGGP